MGRWFRTAAVVALALGLGAATACESTSTPSATGTSAATPSVAPRAVTPNSDSDLGSMNHGETADMPVTQAALDAGLGDCPQRMPGDLLTAEEARVRFNTQMVCLGYVTVVPGTIISWINDDVADHTVTLLDDEGNELNHFEVAAGRTVTTPAAGTGVYRFKTTAIESFTGTIEVQ